MQGVKGRLLLMVLAALVVPACTTLNQHRDTAIGAVAGCAAGYAACLLAKANPAICALACVAGGGLGAGIGAYLDNRRHRLEAAAKQAGVTVAFSDVSTPEITRAGAALPASGGNSAATTPRPGVPSTGATAAPPRKANGLLAELNISEMFMEGLAQPTPWARQQLATLAKVYAQRANALGDKVETSLLITGHTDAIGSPEYNQKLSEDRARTIAELFVANGVPATALYVKGAGSAQPVADNDTEAGRALNRRVEILEVDNERDLVAYSIARRLELGNLSHSTARVPAASVASNMRATARVAPPSWPPPPVPRKAAPGAPQAAPSLPPRDPYEFEGRPAVQTEDDLVQVIGPSAKRLSWRFSPISTATAAQPLRPCYLDRPRIDGEVFKYSDGARVESHATAEYLPGMFGGGWGGLVGQTTLGVGPVAILREDALPVSSPTVYVQPPGKNTPTAYSAVVSTYEGESAVLYRVYVDGIDPPVSCFDIALPKSGPFRSPAGYIFYRGQDPTRTWNQATYRPALVNGHS